jgi:hypothetical protein
MEIGMGKLHQNGAAASPSVHWLPRRLGYSQRKPLLHYRFPLDND